MRRNRDTVRPCPSRAALLAATAAFVVLTAGCTDEGPAPEEQRSVMENLTAAVVGAVADGLEVDRTETVGDPEEPVPCGEDGQVQYRHTVRGRTETFTRGDFSDADQMLWTADTVAVGALVNTADLPGLDLVDSARESGRPATRTYRATDGAAAGTTVAFTFTTAEDGALTVEITGATVCG